MTLEEIIEAGPPGQEEKRCALRAEWREFGGKEGCGE